MESCTIIFLWNHACTDTVDSLTKKMADKLVFEILNEFTKKVNSKSLIYINLFKIPQKKKKKLV